MHKEWATAMHITQQENNVKKLVLTALAFVAATFSTQAPSHFMVFADHYSVVTYLRKEPLFQLGLLSMLIEGAILSALYTRFAGGKSTTKKAFGFSYLMGAFLASYTAFAEAAKYMVPSIASWIAVELSVALIQYTVFGLLLGLVYRERTQRSA